MKKVLLLALAFCVFANTNFGQKIFPENYKSADGLALSDEIQSNDFLKKDKYFEKYKTNKSAFSEIKVPEPSASETSLIINEVPDLKVLKENFLVKSKSNTDTKGDASFVSETDSLALVALYNSTNGSSWSNNTNWLTGPVNSWYGINVNSGLITDITLTANNLEGTIPAELGNIVSLQTLYLDNNQLSGTIPAELGNLTNLSELCLWINQLSGSIPKEIGNLTNLMYLDFDENQLSGSIPAELENLSNLGYLYLDANQLSGNIPAEIGNLENLIVLGLAINQLTGTIPVELGNLYNLSVLNLFNNQLTGKIPAELGDLSNLTSLALYQNQLTGEIPAELGNLSNLEKIYLFTNQLTGTIPTELGSLNNLTTLWLYSNKLSGSIPTELSSLSKLQTLYLQNNQLTGTIPVGLGSLSNLTRLYLGINELTGSIPVELCNLTLLQRLDLQSTQLTGALPSQLNNLSNLSILYINDNSFSNLPDLSSTNIQYFYLQNNELTFGDLENSGLDFSLLTDAIYSPQAKIPEPEQTDNGNNTTTLTLTTDGIDNTYQWYKNGVEIPAANSNSITVDNTVESFYHCEVSNTNYPNLILKSDYLEFHMTASHGVYEEEYNTLVTLYNSTKGDNWTDNTNWLSDNDVNEWFGITVTEGHVTQIHLSNNNLSGSIPAELETLEYITALYLDQNQIAGEIPAELGSLTNLVEFCLYKNQLTGSIPAELGNLVNALYFDVDLNQLTGTIPAGLGNLTSVTDLWLDNNQFSGEIPAELGNLANLKLLALQNNQLTGSIPAELGDLSSLITLYLNDNQLSGEIPSELGTLSSLQYLYLYNNQLTGTIPTELGNISTLIGIYLQNNLLTGTIPLKLGDLGSLVVLNLRDNKLSGSIPSELGNLSNLQYLYLYNNQLTGTIPSSLGSCSLLNTLSLGNNQLTGTIPSSIESLSYLKNLSLLKNQLTGSIPTEFSSLTNLQFLYLNNNKFTGIPDFSTLTNLLTLYFNDNELTFGDLENINIDLNYPYYHYSPQAQLEEPTQTISGDNIILSFTTDGTGNSYQWFKDNEAITGETSNELTVANTESGIFHCEISNSNFNELILTTKAVFFNSSGSHGVTETEYDALVDFYNSTNGVNWKNNTNWLSNEDVSNWFGVTVEAGHVKKIEFIKNGLTGNIPTSIENLAYLERLDLQENGEGISGSIPVEIGTLQNLNYLNLYNNSISGEIPTELGNLSNLEYLNLGFNNLEGEIPAEFGNLTKLYSLSLQNNNLQETIPSEIGYLTELLEFIVNSNELTGSIPDNFANLTNLTYLKLNDNRLNGLSNLGSLSNLQYLYLNENKFIFEDLETLNIDFSSLTAVNYTPQENLEMITHNMYFSEGKSVILSCDELTTEEFSSINNQYAIYQNGIVVRDWSSNPDYEIASFASENTGEYTIQVKNTMYPDLILYSDTLTIEINNAPTDIDLSNISIPEISTIGTTVGSLTTTDDFGDSHIYQLISGDGTNDADNTSFSIDGDILKTAAEFDYEIKSEYHIYIQTQDADGLTYKKAFVISITNNNEEPTNIEISNSSIDENSVTGSVIGHLTTIDIDNGDSFTYSLVAGDGTNDADNASFTINGENLQTAIDLDYETKTEYHIYIQTQDAGGLTFEKAFTINVNDLDDETETGLNDLGELNYLVYPNPSNGNFNIEFNSNNYSVIVYDIVGNIVYNQVSINPKHNINLTGISAGTYFITIQFNDKVLTKKLQIQ